MTSVYDFTVAGADGPVRLWDLHGQVLLIVPIGRPSGATPQLAGLEKLYLTFRDRGLTIVAVPDEPLPGSAAGVPALPVTFPVLAPAAASGDSAGPLFRWLAEQAPGVFGTAAVAGYTKFLVGRDGAVIDRFDPTAEPAELIGAIQQALAQPVPPTPPVPAEPPASAAPVATEPTAAESPAPVAAGEPPAGVAPPAATPPAPVAAGEPPAGVAPPTAVSAAPVEPPVAEEPALETAPSAPVAPAAGEVPEPAAAPPASEAPEPDSDSLFDIAQDVREVGLEVDMVVQLQAERDQARQRDALSAEIERQLEELRDEGTPDA